jgi:signal transduction histidine kinase
MRYVLPRIRNCAIGRVVKQSAKGRTRRRAKVPLRPFSRSEPEQERAAVSEVLRAISNSPHELQPIFDTIIQSATGLCRANYGNLRLPEAEGFRMVAEVSYPPSVAKRWRQPIFNIPDGPLAHMAVNKSPLHIPDLVEETKYLKIPAVAALVKLGGIRTLLIVPMLSNNTVIGAITVSRTRVQPFTEKEIAMVTDFAAQATIALETTRRERQLRELQTELAHVQRITIMGQLTASIAHEVRQPLTALNIDASACLRWLSKHPPEIEEAKRSAECMIKDANRAETIIGRIYGIAKKAQPGKDALDVNGAIQEVVALVQSEAIKNKVTIKMQCSSNLPIIQADRIQLQQVVLNLVINAIQAMSSVSEGQRELHITTARGKESQEVSVAVRDTGPGLTTEDLERVFEPLYTTKPDGMGMGLAICRWIVQQHGGRLWASQADGRGAVFQMTFSASAQ